MTGLRFFAARKQSLLVALVLAVFALLATTYSVVTPVFEGYDENWHFAYVQHIASGKGLPIQPPEEYHHCGPLSLWWLRVL